MEGVAQMKQPPIIIQMYTPYLSWGVIGRMTVDTYLVEHIAKGYHMWGVLPHHMHTPKINIYPPRHPLLTDSCTI